MELEGQWETTLVFVPMSSDSQFPRGSAPQKLLGRGGSVPPFLASRIIEENWKVWAPSSADSFPYPTEGVDGTFEAPGSKIPLGNPLRSYITYTTIFISFNAKWSDNQRKKERLPSTQSTSSLPGSPPPLAVSHILNDLAEIKPNTFVNHRFCLKTGRPTPRDRGLPITMEGVTAAFSVMPRHQDGVYTGGCLI